MTGFTLEQAYFLSQTIASLAVIGSLFYLATQVREQNRESRRRAIVDLTTSLGNWQAALADDPAKVALWLKGQTDYATLEPVEKTRFALMFNHGFRITENLYLDHLDGRISREMFDVYAAPVDHMVTLPGVQAWWDDRQWWFQVPFRTLMNTKIAQAKAIGRPSTVWPGMAETPQG